MTRLAVYLAFKEMWRGKGRFLLISLVIALITTLVLFVAALGEGLGSGNREYLEKLNAELIAFKDTSELSVNASRLDRPVRQQIARVRGVQDVGQVSVTNVSVLAASLAKPLGVALLGVEPGRPGEPPVVAGRQLGSLNAREALLDRNVAIRTGLGVGDEVRIRSVQGAQEEFYTLRVVGLTDGRQFFLQPSVIVPHLTWDRIKPKAASSPDEPTMVSNIMAVRLVEPSQIQEVKSLIEAQVSGVVVVDRKTAYENTPGYSAQQSTLNTQRAFALVIGILVIGGFFQIQTLQKVPQIGMLKAIGASSHTIAIAAVTQILVVTVLGVGIGTLGTLALSLTFPVTIPIIFSAAAVVVAVVSLLLIGPLGGLVSVRYALRVEPLTALGLGS